MVSYHEPRTEQMGFHLSEFPGPHSGTYLGEMDKGLSTRTLDTLTNISLTSRRGYQGKELEKEKKEKHTSYENIRRLDEPWPANPQLWS